MVVDLTVRVAVWDKASVIFSTGQHIFVERGGGASMRGISLNNMGFPTLFNSTFLIFQFIKTNQDENDVLHHLILK